MSGWRQPGRAGRAGRGFSLVELLVAMTLLGVVALAFYSVQHQTQRSVFRGQERADMQQNARAAMQVIVEELRSAQRVTDLASDEVVFLSDRFVLGQERRFYLDAHDQDSDGETTELLLARSPADDGGPGPVVDEVAEGIRSLDFRYLGEGTDSGSGSEVTEPLAVRRIEIALEAETLPPGAEGRRTIALTSQVRPRNLGLPIPPAADSLPPGAPTGFAGEASCGTLALRWNPNPETDVVGYRLYYDSDLPGPAYEGTDADQGRSPIYVGSDTCYVITGLDISRTYYLAVTARDAQAAESNYSTGMSLRPSDAVAPPAPTGINLRLLSESSVVLSWNPVPDRDVALYRISYDDDAPGAPYAQRDSTAGTSATIDGLESGHTYYFVLSAVDACANESPLSAEVSVTPASCDDDPVPPAAPTGLAGLAGDSWVRMQWNASSESDLAYYRLYVVSPTPAESLAVGLGTVYTLAGLDNDVTYQLELAAVDICNNVGPAAGPVALTPTSCVGDSTPPAAPRALQVIRDESPGGDELAISWMANTEPDLAGYVVYCEGPAGWGDTLNVGLSVFATLTGLAPRENHYLTVVAYDRCENMGPISSEVVAVPRPPCDCPPVASISSPGADPVTDLALLAANVVPCSTAVLDEVIFYFDEAEVARFYNPPYWSLYSTTSLADGDYSFRVLAQDINGCRGADTVTVTVDNSGSPAPCVHVDPSVPVSFAGTYNQQVLFQLINSDAVESYQAEGAAFVWDCSEALLHRVEVPEGMAVWDSGDHLEDAVHSGQLTHLHHPPLLGPGETRSAKLYFWNEAADSVMGGRENMPMDQALIVASIVSEEGQVCGPDTLPGDCPLEVTNVVATTGATYQVARLDEAERYYTDRTCRITDIPDGGVEGGFERLIWIKTYDGDRKRGSGFELRCDISTDATVYVGYDQRYTPPTWIRNNYTQVGAAISVNDSPLWFNLWKRDVPAGRVTLYGNYGVGTGSTGTRNYIVLLRCRMGVD